MYEIKGIPTEISATSRVAVKIKDNFYTIEYSEKRLISDIENANMELERAALFDDVNTIVDDQVKDILNSFKR